jgi:hypothetical protein
LIGFGSIHAGLSAEDDVDAEVEAEFSEWYTGKGCSAPSVEG